MKCPGPGVVPNRIRTSRLLTSLPHQPTCLESCKRSRRPAPIANARRAAVSSYGMTGTNVHAIRYVSRHRCRPRTGATRYHPGHPVSTALRCAVGRSGRAVADRRAVGWAPADLAHTWPRRRTPAGAQSPYWPPPPRSDRAWSHRRTPPTRTRRPRSGLRVLRARLAMVGIRLRYHRNRYSPPPSPRSNH